MRDIKFRAWDKTKKEWLFDFRLHPDGRVMKVRQPKLSKDKLWKYENSTEVLSDVELMEYIGFKDKNGKEIWQNDIVKNEDGEIFKIIWGYFSDCCVNGETWILEDKGYQPTVYYQHDDIEVIGNIYENPELLK